MTPKGACREGARAHAAAKRAFGLADLRTAEISHNLGVLYEQANQFREAMDAAREALEIREALLQPDDARIGNTLAIIAKIEEQTEQYAAAHRTYERALGIRRRAASEGNLELAYTLHDYGVYLLRGELWDDCLRCFAEARAILEREQQTTTWYFAALLTNEATTYKRMGRLADADRCYLDALDAYKRACGPRHSRLVPIYANLAEFYRQQGRLADAEWAYDGLAQLDDGAFVHRQQARLNFGLLRGDQGRPDEAIDHLLTTSAFDDAKIGDVFRVVPLAQRANQMRAVMGHVYALLTLMLERKAQRPELAALAHTLILRRKALVQDTLAFERRAQVGDDVDYLTAALRGVTGDAVARAIPPRSALIEYFKYAPYAFGSDEATLANRWRAPHYLALVIPCADLGTAELVNLGEARGIDDLIAKFRFSSTKARDYGGDEPEGEQSSARETAAALRKCIFEPLASHLVGTERLFVAPDSELSLVPLEVLPQGDAASARYLVDDYQLIYLSSGRDVVGSNTGAAPALGPPLVIADPNYDLGCGATSQSHPASEFRLGPFRRLSESRSEGIEVARMLGVEPKLDDDALVSVVKEARRPRILHIATHGFALPAKAEAGSADSDSKIDPLHLSGLALAGANAHGRGVELPAAAAGGILYAFDVVQLDLRGTELVVLSACDSGRGIVRAGDGVYGLRRAVVLAGAKNLVLSLWKVGDGSTKELMVEFYRIMQAGEATDFASALRKAQFAMRERYPDRGAATWGAFICQASSISF